MIFNTDLQQKQSFQKDSDSFHSFLFRIHIFLSHRLNRVTFFFKCLFFESRHSFYILFHMFFFSLDRVDLGKTYPVDK